MQNQRLTQHLERVAQLSRASVSKHFDAYDDIAWDDPEYQIDVHDPIWERGTDDPLGSTAWYQALPQPIRARLGLHLVVAQLKTGVAFESVLSRGLLEFATTLPNGAPEFRYAYHEVIEEGQHSLMFQEFVNRSGLHARGLTGIDELSSRWIPRLGRTSPELFFLFVLGGEAPVDFEQRKAIARDPADIHPLLRKIMRIHVTEEARHICFAESYLRTHVPELSPAAMLRLRIQTPIIFATMSAQMLKPAKNIVQEYSIPRSVLREAYSDNRQYRQEMLRGLESVRLLCVDTGIVTPRWVPFWRALGIWPETTLTPQLQSACEQS